MEREMLYRKVGRRYYPTDEWNHFRPAPGLWLVMEEPGRRSMHLIRGDLPIPLDRVALEQKADEMAEAVCRIRTSDKPWSPMDMVEAMIDAACPASA